MHPHQRAFAPPQERGSVLIQFAIFLSVLVLILGVVDLGYSYYAKRDLQRIADLAALEAVQSIDPSANTNVAGCVAAGKLSVDKNWPAPLNPSPAQVQCGEWKWNKNTADKRLNFTASKTPLNAAHVVLQGESPRFIPGFWNRTVVAEAIAQRSEPSAAFQIGAQLLALNGDAPLGKILGLVGLDVNKLTVLDSAGVANAKITPAGLLKALGVDLGIDGLAALSPEQALKLSNLTLLQILDASAEVASDSAAKVGLKAVIDILKDAKIDSFRLLDMKTPLLGDQSTGSAGLLAFLSLGKESSPNGAALETQIGLGELVKTAIMVGANGHSLQIPNTQLLGAVKLNLTVVEPPTIAVGPIGTKANSAQVRADVNIDSNDIPLAGSVLSALGLRIKLPIKVEGVSADATLTDIYCPDPDRDNQPSIDLGVVSRVAKIFIGDPSKSGSDDANLLVKTPLSLNVRGPISATVLGSRSETTNLIEDETKMTQVNPLLLGDTLKSLTDAIFNLLGGIFAPPFNSSAWSGMTTDGSAADAQKAQIDMLAEYYLESTKVNGMYNVDAATQLVLNGKGTKGQDGYIAPLVDSDFLIPKAIPTTCVITACLPQFWKDGKFSEAFKTYTGVPGGLLDVLGISTLGNGYTNCAGLLSALLAWNTCVKNNLKNLLKNNSSHANLTNSNALVDSLKNGSTCPGALCMLLNPLLEPVKWLLNGVGEAILSPLLNKVLGLDIGRSEVKALDIRCNTAQLVY